MNGTDSPFDDVRNFYKRLDKQDRMLHEILAALKGDDLGNPGLIARQHAIEVNKASTERVQLVEQNLTALTLSHTTLGKAVDVHDRKLWLVAVLGSVAWGALLFFKDYFVK